MKEKNPMIHTVAVRLSSELLESAKSEASQAGISVSDAIRISLNEWVKVSRRKRKEEILSEIEIEKQIAEPKKSDSEILELIKKITNS
jgi:antitoxin component of RelBE/YafQ-DinJ toxin-antitoxin module